MSISSISTRQFSVRAIWSSLLLKELWATGDTQKVADGVLSATNIWGEDLHNVAGLAELLKKDLDLIQEKGMLEAVKTIL